MKYFFTKIIGWLAVLVLAVFLPLRIAKADIMMSPPCRYAPSPTPYNCDDTFYTPQEAKEYWDYQAFEQKKHRQNVIIYSVVGALEAGMIAWCIVGLRNIRRSHV